MNYPFIQTKKNEILNLIAGKIMDFVASCKNGNVENVKKMYSSLGFFSRWKYEKKALHNAVVNDNFPVVQFFGTKKVYPELNSLQDAVMRNKFLTIQWLIPSLPYNTLLKLFDVSIRFNRIEMSMLMLPYMHSLPVDTFELICNRRFIQMKMIVEWGCTVNRADGMMLRSACRYGELEMVQYLIEKGANVRVMNGAPLRLASSRGHFEVVKVLVENGANPSDPDAMKYALDGNFNEIANYLYENGVYSKCKFDVIAMKKMLK
jgi:hypothetical protein